MPDKLGKAYGLTILSPIKQDTAGETPHVDELRAILASLPSGGNSPFAKVSTTHFARMLVIDDVPYQGHPSQEEHLNSNYLLFCSNFDGELDDYLRLMASQIPLVVNQLWGHCVGFPSVGAGDPTPFIRYMRACRIDTSQFFADYPHVTLPDVLKALFVQKQFIDFIENTQGMQPDQLQESFQKFLGRVASSPPPLPGTI